MAMMLSSVVSRMGQYIIDVFKVVVISINDVLLPSSPSLRLFRRIERPKESLLNTLGLSPQRYVCIVYMEGISIK